MDKALRRRAVILAFAGTVALGAPEWKPLFNGKDFAGLYTYVDGQGKNKDPKGYFSVEDSSIHTYAKLIEGETVTFGYVATEKEYSHFRLKFQFKWGTKRFAPRATVKRDAGLMFHVGNDELWPRCVEYQIQEGDVGDIWAIRKIWVTTTVDPNSVAGATKNPKFMEASAGGIVYENPGSTDYVQTIKGADYEIPGWNDVEIYVHGDSAVYYLNGKVNNRFFKLRQRTSTNPDQFASLIKGKVGFQCEGSEVFYRRIDVMDLEGATGVFHSPRAGTAKTIRGGKKVGDETGFDARGRRR